MQWFQFQREFQFVAHRRRAFLISGLLIVLALGSLAVKGLQFGIDFTGGHLVEVGFEQPVDLGAVRTALAEEGFGDAEVQNFGSSREVLIRLPPREESGAALSDQVLGVLNESFDQRSELRRVEFVGPQVGAELRDEGGTALILAMLMILAYVAFRFEKRFALGSVAALVHDVIIVVGVFSFTGIEFGLPLLAALLAVIGYSLNDTIVVFDRIRENFRRQRRGTASEITNYSINQTLPRTLMTSITTLIVLLSLLFLGGEAIFAFAFALTIGVIVGTYSSVFIGATLVLVMGLSRQDMMPVQKEGEADGRP